ncbi:MAG: TAT-variant-translocated molybdopterin oxidoreductase [Planctomycetota bacterium]
MHDSRNGCDNGGSTGEGVRYARAEYWRSADDLEKSPEFRDLMACEFGPNAQELAEGDDRRTFIKLMGAGFALAGLAACRRWPDTKIVPFSKAEPGRLAGVPVHYATCVEVGGIAWPVLAKSFDGRPIKLEGNPALPFAGGSNSVIQSRVLELYDPDRSRTLLKAGQPSTWGAFASWCGEAASKHKSNGGAGLAVLVDESQSPSLADMKTRFLAAYPKAWWGSWSATGADAAIAATTAVLGASMTPKFELAKAKVVLALDADFLGCAMCNVATSYGWAKSRRIEESDPKNQTQSRVYAVEPSVTVTGMSADERFAIRRSDVAVFAALVAKELGVSGVDALAGDARAAGLLDEHGREVFAQLVADLKAAGSAALAMAGTMQDPAVHAIAAAINDKLGAVGTTVYYVPGPAKGGSAQMKELADALASGAIETLVVLGGNPAYDAPADLDFAAKMSKAKEVVHLSFYANETSKSPSCTWHLPAAHSLESWGDGRAIDGSITVQQPLILPLVGEEQGGRNALEVLAELAGDEQRSSYEIVRRAHMAVSGLSGAAFEAWWRGNLDRGFVDGTAAKAAAAPSVNSSALATLCGAAGAAKSTEVAFFFDGKVFDGYFGNLGWLQELPDPATKITWDNALLMAPATARAMGLASGDMVKVAAGSASIEAAVWTLPGHAEKCASIALGYGRGEVAGRVAAGAGFNAYPLRTAASHGMADATVTRTGARYAFAHTQDHGAADALIANVPTDGIQARLPALVREDSLENYKAHPDFARHRTHVAHRLSMWEESNLDGAKYRWAMTIDLSTCTGCSACVVACQAENNVPIVGKSMVARGREMHWIRVDRYFKGKSADTPSGFAVQPLTCMQCENAPCEQVCPVAATVHDEQGINVMVYNRCIGTRYCSNNCPYKVRRFNFFDYHKRGPEREEGFLKVKPAYYKDIPSHEYAIVDAPDAWSRMQFNPEVTVRSRGVMEKCSFCMQRIQEAKIHAKNAWAKSGGTASGRETWSVEDGSVVTACQQACPTQAIVFGDLNDPKSRVSKLVKSQLSYELLEELNTKPRVKYLARVKNPAVNHSDDDHGHGHGHDHDHDHGHGHSH